MDSDLVPARMLNEYVYCPRLFYLEWVEARFADNDDTRIGRYVHRKVDSEAGAAPLPEEGDLRTARSVTLSSETLGVIAKLDVLEGDNHMVIPVDYKKGRPQPDGTPSARCLHPRPSAPSDAPADCRPPERRSSDASGQVRGQTPVSVRTQVRGDF